MNENVALQRNYKTLGKLLWIGTSVTMAICAIHFIIQPSSEQTKAAFVILEGGLSVLNAITSYHYFTVRFPTQKITAYTVVTAWSLSALVNLFVFIFLIWRK